MLGMPNKGNKGQMQNNRVPSPVSRVQVTCINGTRAGECRSRQGWERRLTVTGDSQSKLPHASLAILLLTKSSLDPLTASRATETRGRARDTSSLGASSLATDSPIS